MSGLVTNTSGKMPGPKAALSVTTIGGTSERRVLELLPHPGFTKYSRGYSTEELSFLSDRGDRAYFNPVTITQDNYLLDGYAVWQLANLQQRELLSCIVIEMSEEEALLYLIEKNRGSKGVNDFVRILMALELEPWFKTRAKSNQRIGGRHKGSSQLTEADRLDVRMEIARAAGVSVGNVSKVKQLLKNAIPELQELLRLGEISICRSAEWAKYSGSEQLRRLNDRNYANGIRRTIRQLLRKHELRHPRVCDGLHHLEKGLKALHEADCLSDLRASLVEVVTVIELLLEELEGATDAA